MTSFADVKEGEYSPKTRIDFWKQCLNMMADQPLLGVGPQQFKDSYARRTGGPRVEAHNLWLQTGAEIGIPGLVFLLGFYGLCIRAMVGLVRQKVPADPAVPNLARMVIASLVGFVVSAQFVSLSGLEVPYYVVLTGAGLMNLKLSEVREGEDGASATELAEDDDAASTKWANDPLSGIFDTFNHV